MGQTLKIVPFSGMVPRVADRLLPEGAAVTATNLVLSSGEIRPLRAPLLVNNPSSVGPWSTVYRPEWNGAEKWLAWKNDIDIARAPLSADVEPRYYWTGDYEPRYSTFSNLPSTIFALGVPGPTVAATVASTGGAGSTVSRVYVYTYFSALGEESAPSPASAIASGKVDGTWTVSGMDVLPASTGVASLSTASNVTTFTSTAKHWLRTGDQIRLVSGASTTIQEFDDDSVLDYRWLLVGDAAWSGADIFGQYGLRLNGGGYIRPTDMGLVDGYFDLGVDEFTFDVQVKCDALIGTQTVWCRTSASGAKLALEIRGEYAAVVMRNSRGVVTTLMAPNDPTYDQTVTQLHFDRPDGSTTLVDTGPVKLAWQCVGDARMTIERKAFGTASLQLSGTGYARPTDMTAADPYFDFGTADFAVELWAIPDSLSGIQTLFARGNATGAALVLQLNNGIAELYCRSATGEEKWIKSDVSNFVLMSDNGWDDAYDSADALGGDVAPLALYAKAYMKVSRLNGVISVWAGNQTAASGYFAGALNFDASAIVSVGAWVQNGVASQFFLGCIDEFRASQGNARVGGVQTAAWVDGNYKLTAGQYSQLQVSRSVVNGAGTVRLAAAGVQIASVTFSDALDFASTDIFAIGAQVLPNATASQHMTGVVSEFRFTNLVAREPALQTDAWPNYQFGFGGDPYFTSVYSLLHFSLSSLNGRLVVTSTPTPTSFTIAGNFLGTAVTWARVAPWNTDGMKRRLYRSAGTNATYQLVSDDVGQSYTDTLTDANILGDALISQGWLPPPVGLRGMMALPSGAMAGFLGNQLCYSEPYQPHAWPLAYQYGADHEIVGISNFGTTVVAATAGRPVVSNGVEPSSSSLDGIGEVWPCLSKRSVASAGDGVVFATKTGLAYIGARGAFIWTDPLYSLVEWQALAPKTMVCAVAQGRVFVRWIGTDGTTGTLVFNKDNITEGLTLLSSAPDELYADPRDGNLYLVDASGIYKYDSGVGASLGFIWTSKEYYASTPVNFGVALLDFASEMTAADYASAQGSYASQVQANQTLLGAYSGQGGFDGAGIDVYRVDGGPIKSLTEVVLSAVNMSLYADDKLVFTQEFLTNDGKFRLPAGYRASKIRVTISGNLRVKSLRLAETAADLRGMA